MTEELWRADKEVPPFPVEMQFEEEVGEDGLIKVENPYSKETCRLPPLAVGVYDTIVGSDDILRDMAHPASGFDALPENVKEKIRQESQIKLALGTEWFMIHYPREYYILID